jgi:hypothetical protein
MPKALQEFIALKNTPKLSQELIHKFAAIGTSHTPTTVPFLSLNFCLKGKRFFFFSVKEKGVISVSLGIESDRSGKAAVSSARLLWR